MLIGWRKFPVCRGRSLCVGWVLLAGCGGAQNTAERAPSPPPVAVLTLVKSEPNPHDRITGSVDSWKTEDIGFEVAGRVSYVIEPETDIEGRTFDENGNPISDGTLLARLDNERYRLRVESAQAQIAVTERQKDALRIEVDYVIRAQKEAAAAELGLAKAEIERNTRLLKTKAIAQATYDESKATFDSAMANVAQIEATRQSKLAEVASLDAQIEQQRESLKEAERDLADCELYSPFRGEVASVDVIPGGYVDRGTPVMNVQMMDPIKVEFEVSSDTAQRLHYNDRVDLVARGADGHPIPLMSSVYKTDTTADPETRTFTVTLLLRNRKSEASVPKELAGKSLARTQKLWTLQTELAGRGGVCFVEVKAIHDTDGDAYVWKVLNRTVNTPVDQITPVMKVKKLRVTPGKKRLPFLGLWTLREVEFQEPVDPKNDVFVGELTVDSGDPDSFDGDTVLLDQQRWLLRPGDLVEVRLRTSRAPEGFYVPLDAIVEEAGRCSIFVVEENGMVRKTPVQPRETINTLQRIEAVGDSTLSAGMQVVARGVHYLEDGESVTVAAKVQVQP